MLALISALLGLAPQLLATIPLLLPHQQNIPPVQTASSAPTVPGPDAIAVVEANAINRENLESGQAVPLATYIEPSGGYTVLVVKNGGAAASLLGL